MDPRVTHEINCIWIDGVGGYAFCSASSFQFGSTHGNATHVGVFADIPSHSFTLATVQESAILTPTVAGIAVNGRSIERPCIIKHLDQIHVMQRVELLYRRPHPFSQTAVLTCISRHRWNHHVDGVVLMSNCCVIGNTTTAHISNPHSDIDWMVTREGNLWFISGRHVSNPEHSIAKQVLTPMRRFKGDGIQLTLTVERIDG